MWGNQPYFHASARTDAEAVFGELDAELDPRVLLVGALLDVESDRHPLCVHPEDGDVLLDALRGLGPQIERAKSDDPETGIWHSHPHGQRLSEYRIRGRSFSRGVAQTLDAHRPDRAFFASFPHEIEHHLVTCVLHVDRTAYDAHPRLWHAYDDEDLRRSPVPVSLLDATVKTYLSRCSDELSRAEPGMWEPERNVGDLLRNSGRLFMRHHGRRLSRRWGDDLYDQIDAVSALRYEGAEGKGRVLLTDDDHTGVVSELLLDTPVPLKRARAARKLVEMATSRLDLLATPDGGVYGLGTVDPEYDRDSERVFEVVFLKGNTWELRHDRVPLMRVVGGVPELPRDPVQREDFDSLCLRVLGDGVGLDLDALWASVEAARAQRHGTLVVVSTGAEVEAARLSGQSTRLEPVALTPDLVRAVSSIDGAILVDPGGTCHAVGVILDGLASEGGDPGRGARFNSAHRYVATARTQLGHATLAVVVSEDGTVDVLPKLRPLLSRAVLAAHLDDLRSHRESPFESRTLFNRTLDWVRKHAFYLDLDQCAEVTAIEAEVRETWRERDGGQVWVTPSLFEPHPDFDPSYLVD